MKFALKTLAYILNAIGRSLSPFIDVEKYKPIPLCLVYGRYGLSTPHFVGHNTAPSVSTGSSSSLTSTSFTMGGNITNTGGVNPTVRGFCYVVGAGGTPTTADSVVNESGSFGTGTYSLSITGLSASTTYSVRAYATNTEGTGYGSTVEVTTNGVPVVTTQSPSSVTSTTATYNGNITSTGGATVTRRGFCYIAGTSGTPTTADSVVFDDGSFGTGAYTKASGTLTAEGSYRVRAYAVNASGTGYGTTVQLTLTDNPPTVALNSPSDTGSVADTTPDLTFTGTDEGSDDVRYNIQIDTANTFDSNVVIDSSYAESNQDNQWNVSGGVTYQAAGQGFVSGGGTLDSTKFYLRKVGSPTGNAVSKLYASTGTPGLNATATGSPLATSDNFDVSTLTTSFSLSTLNFSGANRYSMSAIYYIVVIEYTGGDASNYIQVGFDNSSPTATGNTALYNGSWVSNTVDTIFYTYKASGALIDAVSGTDAGFSGTPDNTDPFTSGQQVTYTVQAGDELAATTYYWRVRAIDPSGSNTYGAWSSTRSFTVTSGYADLVATQQSYALTGQSANLLYHRVMTAAQGSFALTGQTTTFSKTYTLAADQASYTLTGVASDFARTYRITCDSGGFTLTGQTVTFLYQQFLTADQQSYSLSGQAAVLSKTFTLVADQASFSLTGYAAGLNIDYALLAAQASFTLTGQAAGLNYSRILTADQQSYALSGYTADFDRAEILVVTHGSFTLSGQATGLTADRQLTADQQSYALTGYDAALAKSIVFVADQASFTLTGNAATLTVQRNITADQQSYTLSGYTADFDRAEILVVTHGSFTLTGQASSFLYNKAVIADQQSYTLTGQAAALTADHLITAAQASFTLTGYTAELDKAIVLETTQQSYSLTGYDATLTVSRSLIADQQSYTLTGQTVSLIKAYPLPTAQASFSLSGQATALTASRLLTAAQGSLTLTGQTTGFTRALTLTAAQGSFALSGFVADFDRAEIMVASMGSFTLTGQAATLTYNQIINGNIKYWNGSEWATAQLKYWDGAQWQDATLKRWNGNTWDTVTF